MTNSQKTDFNRAVTRCMSGFNNALVKDEVKHLEELLSEVTNGVALSREHAEKVAHAVEAGGINRMEPESSPSKGSSRKRGGTVISEDTHTS